MADLTLPGRKAGSNQQISPSLKAGILGAKFPSQQAKISNSGNAFPPPPPVTTPPPSHPPSPSHTYILTHTHTHMQPLLFQLSAGTITFINSWECGPLSGETPVAYQGSFASTFRRVLHLHVLLLLMYLPWAHVDEIFVAKGSEMAKIKYLVN